jgi:hypothetical protein
LFANELLEIVFTSKQRRSIKNGKEYFRKEIYAKKLTVRNCKGCRIKLCLTFAQLSARDIVAI